MKDLLLHVEQVFNEYKLIGNHDFTEDEYSLMVDAVSNLHDNFDKNSYKLIFATLVEIAKRWKQSDSTENDDENRGYWEFVFKTLFGSYIDQQLCQKYRNVISWLGVNSRIPVVTGGQNYYSTLMMHSFAPKNSIYSFFELCYIIFKNDFDFGFTKDDELLCESIARQIVGFLGHGYSEDKKVTIGSSAYSIKIGLRSFALHEDLSDEFVYFLKNTFVNINKLFNREEVPENIRCEKYIVRWWKNKAESEKLYGETAFKKRFSTVSKHNIVAKYFRNEDEVQLIIPSIRIDGDASILILSIYVNGGQVYSEALRTKRGELVVATRQMEFQLNNLLIGNDLINLRIEITENSVPIFDSEKNKASSLNREFILFDGENEVFSKILKPTNYFVYSKNIDTLISVPNELSTINTNFYNIYPKNGECIKAEFRHVFFIDKEKSANLGTQACFIGDLTDVEWQLDDISCMVFSNSVNLMVPENLNLKALELRIDRKTYLLNNLKNEELVNGCYQFELKELGLILDNEPIGISLYSYEKEVTLLNESIILLPKLDFKFNKSLYYGETERKVTITTESNIKELTWSNQDYEIKSALLDGLLLIKIPYFKWRLFGEEWHNEMISRNLWYKDFLTNGSLLEIDSPKEDEKLKLVGFIDGKPLELFKNHNGKFEIGRAIYSNSGKKVIPFFCSYLGELFVLFNVSTQVHFLASPLVYRNRDVFWDVESTFIGDKKNEFFLILKGGGNNCIRTKIGNENCKIANVKEDIYKITVKIKDKNIFSKEECYNTILEENLIVGKSEKFRFNGKMIRIKEVSSSLSNAVYTSWKQLNATYIIHNLEYVEVSSQEQTNGYYIGNLGFILDEKITNLNFLENEKGELDKINPVRIEMINNNSFWLVADYSRNNDDFEIEALIYDKSRHGLCNFNSKDVSRYCAINLYKFEVIEYV